MELYHIKHLGEIRHREILERAGVIPVKEPTSLWLGVRWRRPRFGWLRLPLPKRRRLSRS